jgi:predicted dehydrogenase
MGADVLRIGLIGTGSMGTLHARVISQAGRTNLAWVADPNDERGQQVAARYGSVWIPEPDLDSVDAVVIAAPTQFHHTLAASIIDAGLPLLLEKPLADTLDQSRDLVERAQHRGSVLMCGLLERFNPAVRTAMDIAREPVHVATVRHSPYAERILTGVAGDLLIHDIDLVLRLFGSSPESVSGQCGVFEPRSLSTSEDVADAILRFPGGRVATLSASRVSQRKVRSLSIGELGRLIEVDLLRQDITVYRHVQTSEFDEDAGYSQQTIIDIPVVRHLGEPLQLQLQRFVDLVDGLVDPAEELAGLLPPHEVVAAVLSASTADSVRA